LLNIIIGQLALERSGICPDVIRLNFNMTAIVNSMLQQAEYDSAMMNMETLQSQLEQWKTKAEENEKTAKLVKEYKDNINRKDEEIKRLKEQVVSLTGGESKVKNTTKRLSVMPNLTPDQPVTEESEGIVKKALLKLSEMPGFMESENSISPKKAQTPLNKSSVSETDSPMNSRNKLSGNDEVNERNLLIVRCNG
jgi:hypothetical protein